MKIYSILIYTVVMLFMLSCENDWQINWDANLLYSNGGFDRDNVPTTLMLTDGGYTNAATILHNTFYANSGTVSYIDNGIKINVGMISADYKISGVTPQYADMTGEIIY